MRIIFDIHNEPDGYLSSSGTFLTDLIREIATRYRQHAFIYLVQKPFPKMNGLPDNVSVSHINNVFSKWFGKRFAYGYFLSKNLKTLKGDLFVTADNMHFSNSAIPVCLFLLHSTEVLQKAYTGKKVINRKKNLTRAIRQASKVITFSEDDRQAVLKQSQELEDKVNLLYPRTTQLPELKWTEKEIVKVEFAAGSEYFLFAGDLHERFNLIDLLKAFSLFKKWQQSSMQLLIAGNKTPWTEKFSQQLSSYKHRSDVKLIINPSKENLQKIIGGAYAFVYPAVYDTFPVNILRAMQVGVPVITSPIPVCKDWCKDAVIYPESIDAGGFAKSMQLIYKDERLRSDFIDAAKKMISSHEQEDPVESCMNFFQETIAK